MLGLSSLENICEVSLFSGPDASPEAGPDLFIELPHGATRLRHLQAARSLTHQYPGEVHDLLFLANTDQGSPEYATLLAKLLTDPLTWENREIKRELLAPVRRLKVLVLRSLLPRTILDVNRLWATTSEALSAGITRGVPGFVTDADDLEKIHTAFLTYQEMVSKGYAAVMANGGFALQLHTYAPISVNNVDGEYIVDTLREAYRPENYGNFPVRPLVQLITTPPDGPMLSNPVLRDMLVNAYAACGIEAVCDSPFNLHPATMAYVFAKQYPGRTLTMEISRAELAQTFDPFREMVMCPKKLDRMTFPIAEAYLRFLAATG